MKLRWLVAWFASFGLVASCSDDGNNPCVAGAQDCTGPETVPCQNATECPAGQVCDPLTGECSGGLPCSTHSDCGSAAFCDNGTCAPNNVGGPCDTHDNCLPGGLCADGTCSCGGALYGAENTPANVLVVLDRSDSMNDDIGGGTKWDIARQAIDDMLAAHGDSIHFGLMLYPGTNQSGTQGMTCGPGAVFVDPGPMTAGDITFFLSGADTTSFGTPTAEALEVLIDYPGLEDFERSNYVMLITDGQSTCADPVPVVTALRSEMPEIKTFVVGFGSGVDPNELNDMAQAGGTAQAQAPYYYQADDATSLAAAFGSIAGTVFSCSYTLSDTPPDPNQLYVYIDGNEVPQDPVDGWTYDPVTNQITFHGASCDMLSSGTASELVISYGCPLVEIN